MPQRSEPAPSQLDRGAEAAERLAAPPLRLARRGEAVAPEVGAHEARRPVREGVLGEEREHRGLALEQAQEEAAEPRARLAAAERGEPKLPVEARQVERGETRRALRRPRLVAEDVGPPGRSVVAPEDLDLPPLGRHHGEEAVGVRHEERSERALEREQRARHRERQAEARDRREEREGEERRRRADEARVPDARPRTARRRGDGLRRRRGEEPRGEQAGERAVVEEGRAEHEGQRVEEAVVAGRRDRELETGDAGAGDEARAPAGEDQQREAELDRERREGRRAKPGAGELVREPARPGRERLRLEVMGEGAETAPARVSGEELHGARHEDELREQAARQPDRERMGRGAAAAERQQAPRRHEQREEARLEQQRVPLVGEEDPAGGDEREVEREEAGEGQAGRYAERDRDGERRAGGAERVQRRVAGAEPEQCRALERRAFPSEAREQARRRGDPAAPEEALELHLEREEGREVDPAEASDERADDEADLALRRRRPVRRSRRRCPRARSSRPGSSPGTAGDSPRRSRTRARRRSRS
jgi:hypothetical protein